MPPTNLLRRYASDLLANHHSLFSRSADMLSSAALDEPWRPTAPSRFAAPSFADLRRRQVDKRADASDGSDRTINLMLIVLGLVFFALVLVALLVFFRRRRQRRQRQGLPTYSEVSQASNPRGLTIETAHNGRSSIVYIGRDGQPMLQNPNSPPHSPDNVPEIHITFPDEHDHQGRPQSGRRLVVRVGDNATVGLEPMHDDEQLPAYEKEGKGQFQSIDMDQIGGLKEKDRTVFQ
ncbi:hypothetical protein HIM_07652 [Hirsutella minnesotensis 3608]|uniref:Uncharacterized protein n=1 Tax=Hirsutella minnesotensis 3608 TaxID=1043627 RepID=A0A0F8A435_9HYPO|nr:hypothetical protein HIM_07652 [Hirsutella minnesotensis 3608]